MCRTTAQRFCHAVISAFALTLGLWAFPAYSAQSGAQFVVTAQLAGSGVANTGLCRSSNRIGVFGKTLTIVCATGEPVDFKGNPSSLPWSAVQDGSYRFVTVVSRAGEPTGAVDSYAGIGTITSWRVISLVELDYLEMMVHW